MLRIGIQLVLLGVLYTACTWVVARTGLPVPAGLLSLVLLIALLLGRVVPEEVVSAGADALLRILPVLFLPPGIGIIRELHLVRGHALGLGVVLLVSLVVGQLVAGLAAERAARREHR